MALRAIHSIHSIILIRPILTKVTRPTTRVPTTLGIQTLAILTSLTILHTLPTLLILLHRTLVIHSPAILHILPTNLPTRRIRLDLPTHRILLPQLLNRTLVIHNPAILRTHPNQLLSLVHHTTVVPMVVPTEGLKVTEVP